MSSDHGHSTSSLLIQTVEQNKKQFTQRDIKGAEAARKLQRLLNNPSHDRFVKMIANNQINNCTVTLADVKNALLIFGSDERGLKGWSVRKSAPHAGNIVPTHVPAPILHQLENITLCMDNFVVQGLHFFTTISRKLKFRTVNEIGSHSKETLLNATASSNVSRKSYGRFYWM